jgi:group I intron endonuclease
MKTTGYIYKITSPKGLIYIGQTVNYKNRFRQYRGLRCKSQPALFNSFVKYGVDNHTFEIIDQCDKSELSKLEIHYISFFDSWKNGLNCTIGGDSGFMTGEDNVSKKTEVKEKMSKAKSEYYKDGRKNPLLGSKRPDEVKDKLKKKRADQEKSGKPIRHIMVLDTTTGLFFDSLKEACLATTNNMCYKRFHYFNKKNGRFLYIK